MVMKKGDRQNVLRYVKEAYNTEPEYLWKTMPDYMVFRHTDNRKWYGIIMTVPGNKLGMDDELIDILDLKCDPVLCGSLLGQKGFLPAYHMHKGNWITVLLNKAVKFEMICSLIDMSFELTIRK